MKENFNSKVVRILRNLRSQIHRRKWNTKIQCVSASQSTRCEWCTRTTQVVFVGFEKLSKKGSDFSEGFCNFGQMTIFQDSKFHLQSEWWVCGRCKNS